MSHFELSAPPHYTKDRETPVWKTWYNTVYEKLRGPLWYDLTSAVSGGKVPASNAPTYTAFGPTGTNFQFVFSINDHIQLNSFVIPHDLKPNTSVYPNIHWTTDGTVTDTVKWELSYTQAKGHNQAAFPADTVISVTQAASGTAWQHMVAEVSTTDAITSLEPDSIVLIRVKRVTNGGTDNTDDVFGISLSLHYQKDRLGTPRKTPDFYNRRAL